MGNVCVFTCLRASTQEYLRNPFVLARTPAAKEDYIDLKKSSGVQTKFLCPERSLPL
jgi:hypothetical protein